MKMKNDMKFAAVIFDLDGTLIDSEAIHAAAFREASATFGVRLTDEEIMQQKGRSVAAIYHAFAADHPEIAAVDEALFVKKKIQAFDRLSKQSLAMFPDARPFLQLLKNRDFKLGLVTSATGTMQLAVFERFDLASLFDIVVTADDLNKGKPNPEPYLLAIERLKIPAARCVVVEDAPAGICSAKAAGCFTVGITHTFPKKTLLEVGADVAVSSFDEVLSFLN